MVKAVVCQVCGSFERDCKNPEHKKLSPKSVDMPMGVSTNEQGHGHYMPSERYRNTGQFVFFQQTLEEFENEE